MCGIFGIINPTPRKFDLQAFCVLGVNNDSRGGDSCGIFIDKEYEYGVNESKLFYSFFPKSKLLNSVKKSQIALGHCRKASVGAINEANAQPVVIKNSNGDVEYVLIHNGTIVNYQELAKQYIPDIDIKNMTDSQVMARIFYHAGYKVLGEYIGAGAFVMVDYRGEKPKVLLFKGESKSTQYAIATTIERPLYMTYNNTEFIFSSIMEYLKALRPGREVYTLTPNTLTELENGTLYNIAEYDRTQKWQQKTYATVYQSSWKQDNNVSTKNNFNEYYWEDAIEWSNGSYYIGTRKAHGIHRSDSIGYLERTKKRVKNTFQVAFWQGVLLKNTQCYYFLSKFAKDMSCTPEELLTALPDLVYFLSPCPYWRDKFGYWVTSDTSSSHFRYTGLMSFPFTTEKLVVTAGIFSKYIDGVPYSETIKPLQEASNYRLDPSVLPCI